MAMENKDVGELRRQASESSLKRKISKSKFKSPGMDFFTKKRKRHVANNSSQEDDNVSMQSVDLVNLHADTSSDKKRRRSKLSASVANLSALLSPQRLFKSSNVVNTGDSDHDSSICSESSNSGRRGSLLRYASLRSLMSPHKSRPDYIHQDTPFKKPRPAGPSTPTKKDRRQSEYWYQTINDFAPEKFDQLQIQRQEAIYELFKGEEDLVRDLQMVMRTYRDVMKNLGLLSEDEMRQIFGIVEDLVPLHERLVDELKDQRLPDGTTEFVGQVLVSWIPCLHLYADYCSNQVFAKALLDEKKHDPGIIDFLQRCLDSPFSRRLDLWSFLDVPRSKLVKYPLLFKAILKKTPPEHSDYPLLERAILLMDDIVKLVDEKTGEGKCKFTKAKLDYLDDAARNPLIDESSVILCDGTLKNKNGTKLYVILFDKILVLTRPSTRTGKSLHQVYTKPIPLSELVLEDAESKVFRLKGSFRKKNEKPIAPPKNVFWVGFANQSRGPSHCLQANDVHGRMQWTSIIRSHLPPDAERQLGDGQDDYESFATSTPSPSRRDRHAARRHPSNCSAISTSTMDSTASSGLFSMRKNASKSSLMSISSISSMASVTTIDSGLCHNEGVITRQTSAGRLGLGKRGSTGTLGNSVSSTCLRRDGDAVDDEADGVELGAVGLSRKSSFSRLRKQASKTSFAACVMGNSTVSPTKAPKKSPKVPAAAAGSSSSAAAAAGSSSSAAAAVGKSPKECKSPKTPKTPKPSPKCVDSPTVSRPMSPAAKASQSSLSASAKKSLKKLRKLHSCSKMPRQTSRKNNRRRSSGNKMSGRLSDSSVLAMGVREAADGAN